MSARLSTPSSVPPVATAAPQRTPMGPSAAALLCGLFERARPALTADELGDLAMHGDTASQMVGGLAALCMGLGAMLNEEAGDLPSHALTGCFQRPEDVARLLFLLSNVADQAHGLLQLAGLADAMRSLSGRAAA